jgi:2-oxoglutarate dehydrogenase E1 component
VDEARLADAFRRWGYLQADLDPLGRLTPLVHADLEGAEGAEAERWRSIYCGPIGAEFMQIRFADRARWIARRMESPPPGIDRRRVLERLAAAEIFERFLHRHFVGTKRYSLEGAAGLIPLLDSLLDGAAESGAETVLLAMSHRGRLNVMTQVLGVPPSSIFAEFEDVDPRSVLGGGDVRYHLGATGEARTVSGRVLQLHLVSNPSHLEAVNPVLMGRARARQTRLGLPGRARVLPVNLHGDAAFAGQGIAAECLNLSELPGFNVGGTIHVVVNNLLGFTTSFEALHSSRFATDVARRLDIPILHVNGQDPDAVVRAGRLAMEYRAAFATDVVVDLIGFRRYGHSEVDDPTTTQPLLYQRIASLPMLWEEYAARIGIGEEEMRAMERGFREGLEAELERGRAARSRPVLRRLPGYWDPFTGGPYDPAGEVDTAVGAALLEDLGQRLARIPGDFHVHPKVGKGLEERLAMSRGEKRIDWGMAEALAFGSLLRAGTDVRLSGQDSRRGTFNQRHAVLFDARDGREHAPLSELGEGQGRFEIVDTPLTEAAALGFEYGYSRDRPEALVCWEAQFGDFANGAQILIDQFLVAGEDKWGLLSGLVLLLPHGYEGQGPEHSSARPERLLALAGEDNIQVCQPSTAAQYFHLLRRQALRRWRKPLAVLTPKSLLRSPVASSPREDFLSGRFRTVLAEETSVPAGTILACSGKIGHELAARREKLRAQETLVVRLEQLYPFPEAELRDLLRRQGAVRRIVWVQEEPGNMGALSFVRPRLQALARSLPVTSVHRAVSASPATGSAAAHAMEQEALLSLAFAPLRNGEAGSGRADAVPS